ncbi:MAG: FAD:protein FMN transferase [Comamonadaceae bacterium]|nr:FAD:protein FMN transferase [Comamonadaceae bacterium]
MADLAMEGARVTSRNAAVRLDLGGYAKGYALDRAAAILRAQGMRNALINIGGNVMALGDKGGRPWRVGIQHPRAPMPIAMLRAAGRRGDRHLGRLPALFRSSTASATAISSTRAPAGRRRARRRSRSWWCPAAALRRGRRAVGCREQAAVHRGRRRLARDGAPAGHRHALRIDASGSIAATRALRERLTFAEDAAPIEVVE